MVSRRIVTTSLALATAALLCNRLGGFGGTRGRRPFTMPEFDGSNNKIAAGPDGNIWMGSRRGIRRRRITPAGGVENFNFEDLEHPAGIAAGPEGRMWVTDTNKVGLLPPSDPEGTRQVFTIFTVTSKTPIVAGPDGQMWVAASDNVVHFSPADPERPPTADPVPGLSPRDIDVAGSLLVVADSGNKRIVT